jgi:3-oxoacyl-[acyl-carrier-protein] synthase II
VTVKATVTGVGWVNGASSGYGRQTVFKTDRNNALPKLSGKDFFYKPFPRYGRMDEYSRLGIAGIAFALKDAGLDEWTETRNIAIIASTVNGCLNTDGDYFDTVIPEGGRLASPNLFAYTLPNTYLGEAAIHFGLTGATFVINEPALSGLSGLNIALDSISRESYEAVITGVCDAGTPSFLTMIERVVPCALFLVLQKVQEGPGGAYGELTRSRSGEIFFHEERVENLGDLARMCTTGIRAEKGNRRDI